MSDSILNLKVDGQWVSVPALKGETGNSAVHYGTEAPTDPEIKIWVDPEGTPYEMPVSVVGQRLIFN